MALVQAPAMEMTIQAASHEEAMALFGPGDRNLRLLREAFEIEATGRGATLRLVGDKALVEGAASILTGMLALFRSGGKISSNHVEKEIEKRIERPQSGEGAVSMRGDGPEAPRPQAKGAVLVRGEVDGRSSQGLARSPGQEVYLEGIQGNEIVFCIGPAGTGKTFLAVHMAVTFLREGLIRRIILCRPAVEAGEKLGFLPGDFQAKINPYLRPLYDALNDILDYDQVKRYLEREIIEIIPLAYMRGRTLNNAFIILDEGQNTSVSQMKMFLTRMGMDSRIVVNGDVTQVDLPEGVPSGLIHAQKIIKDIPGIAWIRMEKRDIVRHPLVRRIVEAYESETGTS